MAASLIQSAAASLLSSLKSKFRTSLGAVDYVVKEVNHLTNLFLDFLKERLSERCALQDGYLTLDQIFSELDALRDQSLFEGVQSHPYLDAYVAFKSSANDNPFGLKKLIFSWKEVYRRGIPYEVPEDYIFFPPFLSQLEQLLNCKDVLHCVDNPRISTDGIMRSVTDGYFYRYHYIVQQHGSKVLCIIIYVDDVEFADPCKSKTKKHKLRLFYWTLGNIYPELRSTLKAINLLAIARYEVAKKWGNEEILKCFVDDLQQLSTGVKMIVNGEERIFYGLLQFVAADIPAAANIGGFKESHFALRPCRVCMATRFEICEHFTDDERLLRGIEDHIKYVNEIEAQNWKKKPFKLVDVELDSALCNEDEQLAEEEELDETDMIQDSNPVKTYADHPNPSINYGINKRSVLADVPGFDVTKCLPYDIMHVFFEGCVQTLCRLILKEMCTRPNEPRDPADPPPRKRRKTGEQQVPQPRKPSKQAAKKSQKTAQQQVPQSKPKLSLKYVNEFIQERCDFGHLQVSKPSVIEKSHLDSKLKQSASQMIVLVHILPVIAKDNIAEEKLDLLGLLIKILAIIMKFESSPDDRDNLDSMVEEFAEKFVKLYPDQKTLKLHALRHLKMQILLHGTLRQQGCFRYEAMHREFTRLVDVINNMINIEYSLVSRHISARNCDIMNGKHDGTFLYQGHTITKSPPNKLEMVPEKDILFLSFPQLNEESDIFTVNKFEIHGRVWKKDVIISLPGGDEAGFGIIVKIYEINGEMVFLFNNLKVAYLSSFHAYEILKREKNLSCVKYSHLKLKFPVLRFTVHYKVNVSRSFLMSGSSGDIVA